MRKESRHFQAETKELLNLMIHSIYTHKEIFLRELISNASDAIDKFKFKSLTETDFIKEKPEFKIELTFNKEKKELTITDNGIGMTYDEVLENIGTIAKSGSKAFLEKAQAVRENTDIDIIGQFGVGFYSAFMVADKITLKTKSPYSDNGVIWSSNGEGEYEIEEADLPFAHGTAITLHMREDEECQGYLDSWKIKDLVKKYSDYVRYPILLEGEQINSTKPIWKTSKDELSEEDYNEFYKTNFHDWEDPLFHIHLNVQGTVEYSALLYIPRELTPDFYSREFKKGLQLYTKNVFIMDKCDELIPNYFSFVKGLVDTDNLSLNISREILQKNSELQAISKNLERKIISELEKLLRDDKEKYIKMWKNFGRSIKYGIQDMYGVNKDKLKKLLIFISSADNSYTTLNEYIDRIKSDQNEIYYVAGDDLETLKLLPKVEVLKKKGFEVLYLTDNIDEFALKTLGEFEGKKFKSINDADFSLESVEEKEKLQQLEKENESLLGKIKEILSGKISEVKMNSSLGSGAVAVSTKGEISLEMEKVLSQIPGNEGIKAEKVLEINPEHPLFKKLQTANNPEVIKDLVEILYTQGMLLEGFQIENPVEFINKLNNLLSR